MDNILESVRAILRTTPACWLNLTESIPTELLVRPPALKEWSALECLQHLVDTERWVFPVRVKAFLAGQDFPAFNPDSQGTKLDVGQVPGDLARELGGFALRA